MSRMVARGGIEPPTRGFSIRRSTAELPRQYHFLVEPRSGLEPLSWASDARALSS